MAKPAAQLGQRTKRGPSRGGASTPSRAVAERRKAASRRIRDARHPERVSHPTPERLAGAPHPLWRADGERAEGRRPSLGAVSPARTPRAVLMTSKITRAGRRPRSSSRLPLAARERAEVAAALLPQREGRRKVAGRPTAGRYKEIFISLLPPLGDPAIGRQLGGPVDRLGGLCCRRTVQTTQRTAMTAAAKKAAPATDYVVEDIGLADWGRKEIAHRRDRDAGPDGDARGIRRRSSRSRARASPARCT